jgi:hypothetical protein
MLGNGYVAMLFMCPSLAVLIAAEYFSSNEQCTIARATQSLKLLGPLLAYVQVDFNFEICFATATVYAYLQLDPSSHHTSLWRSLLIISKESSL